MNIGITGQSGFIGSHLYNYLKTMDGMTLIPFQKDYFEKEDALDRFIERCDVVVHLAGMNRGQDQEVSEINIGLAEKLVSSLDRTHHRPHVIFSSTTQETRGTPYGESKKKSREAISKWAHESRARFTGLIIPNIYGPFCRPFYNSVVATFCFQLTHGQEPKIIMNQPIGLLYVGELVQRIFEVIRKEQVADELLIPAAKEIIVSELLSKLTGFKETYLEEGVIPDLADPFDLSLFNTFRSYIDTSHYPIPYDLKTDDRGSLFEVVRSLNKGQAFFSSTKPGVERGNQYHRRKVERFSIIKGRALVQLRRIGAEEIVKYTLDGDNPSYVDLPILHTHNLINTGDEELHMLFWASELYDPDDPDTYHEKVEVEER